MNQRAGSPGHSPTAATRSLLSFWTVVLAASSRGMLSVADRPETLPDAAGHFGKIKPFTSFLPHLRNESAYLHISCGRFKAGAGKEMGGLKPTTTSTKNSWTCSTAGNKGGIAGLEKGLMVSCALPIKPCRPALEKGYGAQGLGSAQRCHHPARAGRSVGTGGWETEVFKRDFRCSRVLP